MAAQISGWHLQRRLHTAALFKCEPDLRLLIDDGPVRVPDHTPSAVQLLSVSPLGTKRILSGSRFVDLHAPTRLLVRIRIAVLHHGIAIEDFLNTFVRRGPFLNAEI